MEFSYGIAYRTMPGHKRVQFPLHCMKFSYGFAYITLLGHCRGWGAARSEPPACINHDSHRLTLTSQFSILFLDCTVEPLLHISSVALMITTIIWSYVTSRAIEKINQFRFPSASLRPRLRHTSQNDIKTKSVYSDYRYYLRWYNHRTCPQRFPAFRAIWPTADNYNQHNLLKAHVRGGWPPRMYI